MLRTPLPKNIIQETEESLRVEEKYMKTVREKKKTQKSNNKAQETSTNVKVEHALKSHINKYDISCVSVNIKRAH